MTKRPSLAHRVEFIGFDAVRRLSGLLGLERNGALLAALARGIGPLSPLRARGAQNLRIAFPDLPRQRESQILSGMFDHLARTANEYPHLPQILAEEDRVTIEGAAYYEAAMAAGKGAVLVSGHFGNWEAVRIACARIEEPPALIYRGFNNGAINLASKRMMEALGAPVLLKGKRGTLSLLRHLKKGGAVMILTDQRFRGAPELPFFGRGATTALAAAELAAHNGAPLIPVRGLRLGRESRFAVTFEEPIPVGSGEDGTRAAMTAFNARLEDWIREAPEQYFWLHNRWGKG